MITRTKIGIGGWALSCVLAFIGSLMPWATAFGMIDVAGTDGDGVIVIIVALVSAVLAARHWFSRSRLTAWTGLVMGLVIAVIGVVDTADVARIADDADGVVSVGAGLYVVIVAGAAMIVATLILITGGRDGGG